MNKYIKIIVILAVLLILTIITGVVLFFTTDLFTSKDILFKKYLLQNFDVLEEIIDIKNEETYLSTISANNIKEETNATLKFIENKNDEEEVYQLQSEKINNKEQNSAYRKTSIKYEDELIENIENLKEDNIYGLRFSNLVEQFVSIKNINLPYVISGMGLDGNYFGDSLKIFNIEELLSFTEEEKNHLKNTYLEIVFSNISKKNFTSSKAIITLSDGSSPETTKYSFSLTQNELDNIYRKIIQIAIDDNVILSKLEKIDNKLTESGINILKGESIKTTYINYLKELENEMQYEGKNDRKITFSVYKFKNNTLRTEVKSDTHEITIDLNKPKNEIILKIVSFYNSEVKTEIYSTGKQIENGNIIRNYSINNSNKNLKGQIQMSLVNNNSEINNSFEYNSEEITRIQFNSNSKFEQIASDEKMPVKFKNKNNILLNNQEKEKIKELINSLKEIVTNSLNQTQSKINTKLIDKILIWIDGKQKEKEEQQDTQEKTKIQVYNSQFEFYKGENVTSQNIMSLLEVVKENIDYYEVINGNTMRIHLKQENKNDEKMNEITNQIQDKYQYNVNINYDETGMAQSIDIQVILNKK